MSLTQLIKTPCGRFGASFSRWRRRNTAANPHGRLGAYRPSLELLETRELLTGTWQVLANPVPTPAGQKTADGAQMMMLLPDGSVMVQGGAGSASTSWYKLDFVSGPNYHDGLWSTRQPMNTARLFYGSAVLRDGRVFVVGGEYSAPYDFTNTSEIFDLATGLWTPKASVPTPATQAGTQPPPFAQAQFGDDPIEVLPDGRVLAGYFNSAATYVYDPTTDKWTTTTGNKLHGDRSDEETWVKLPDDSILSYDVFASESSKTLQAQRYIPNKGTWVDASKVDPKNTPGILSDPPPPPTPALPNPPGAEGDELGPAFLQPDGHVIFFGANGKTALYTPATDTWSAGPSEPARIVNGNFIQLVAADAPGAELPNGNLLLAFSPLGGLNASGKYTFPKTSFVYEYNPATKSYVDVTPDPTLGFDMSQSCYNEQMLVLPTGQVLMSNDTGTLALYSPDGSPKDAWRPTISDIASNGTFSNGQSVFTLTGTRLNGISEGATYGDDAEMSSNYPIIQLATTQGGGGFARTFNWSSTGVATGHTSVTTQFAMNSILNVYKMSVIANGIPSYAVLDVQLNQLTTNVVIRTNPNLPGVVQVLLNNSDRGDFFASDLSGIFVSGDNASSTINLVDTLPSMPVTISAGSGTETVNISAATGTGQITINLKSGGHLVEGNTSPVVINAGAGTVETVSTAPLTVFGTAQTHVIITQASKFVTINDAGFVTVGKGRTDLIKDLVSIHTGHGLTTVIVDDSKDTDALGRRFIVGQGGTAGFTAGGAVSYDALTVASLTIKGGSGANYFQIASASQSLDTLPDPIAISSVGLGRGTLVVDGSGSDDSTYAVDDRSIARSKLTTIFGKTAVVLTNTITYAGIANVQILGGKGGDIFHIGSANRPFSALPNAISVSGGSGTDTLIVDARSSSAAVYTVTDKAVLRSVLVTIAGKTFLNVTNTINYAAIDNVQVLGGKGADTFILGGAAVSIDDLPMAISVSGGGGVDSLVVDGRGSPASTFDVTGNVITRHELVTIAGQSFQELTNTISYAGIAKVQVLGGAGANTFHFGSLAEDLGALVDPITIAGNGADTLIVDGRGSLDSTFILGNQSVQRYATFLFHGTPVHFRTNTINYSGMANLQVLGGATTSTSFTVQNTTAGTPVSLVGGPMEDRFVLGDDAHSLGAMLSPVTVDGQGGGDTLVLDDRAPGSFLLNESRGFLVTDQQVEWDLSYGSTGQFGSSSFFSYSSVAAIDILGNAQATAYRVESTAAGAPVALTGAGDGDSFQVGDATHSLDGIKATVTVSDFSANPAVLISDEASTTAQTITLTASGLVRGGNDIVDFPAWNPSQFTLNAGAGANGIGVNSTAAGTNLVINGGVGPGETIAVSADQDAILGPIALHFQSAANDLLEYLDTNNPNPQTYTVTANTISRTGQVDVAYDGTAAIFLFEPAVGGNTTYVRSVAAGSLFRSINSNGDQVIVGNLAPTTGGNLDGVLGTVEVAASNPNDQIALLIDDSGNLDTTAKQVVFSPVRDGDGFVNMLGLAPGSTSIAWNLPLTSSVTILGGAANATFVMQPIVAETPLTIVGGSGLNTLDYAAYTTGVTVDLAAGTATDLAGISDPNTGRITIQNVIGGSGNDTLMAGADRSILIGGGGADQLVGGSGEDILIAGTTDYTQPNLNAAALDAILQEWNRTDLGFDDRMSDLLTGSNALGVPAKNVIGGTAILLNSTTVHDDLAADVLTGGTSRDWYFIDVSDLISNKKPGDVVTMV